jgi:hypothetical protein
MVDGPPTLVPTVVPLGVDLGTAAGHRLLLLSLEVWADWADLRFARIDPGGAPPLARRVPPATAWTVTADGLALTVIDAVGRGDRTFSNGEVRLAPPPAPGATLEVTVEVAPGAVLTGRFTLGGP